MADQKVTYKRKDMESLLKDGLLSQEAFDKLEQNEQLVDKVTSAYQKKVYSEKHQAYIDTKAALLKQANELFKSSEFNDFIKEFSFGEGDDEISLIFNAYVKNDRLVREHFFPEDFNGKSKSNKQEEQADEQENQAESNNNTDEGDNDEDTKDEIEDENENDELF